MFFEYSEISKKEKIKLLKKFDKFISKNFPEITENNFRLSGVRVEIFFRRIEDFYDEILPEDKECFLKFCDIVIRSSYN